MPSVTMTTSTSGVNSINTSGGQLNINNLTVQGIKDKARKEIPTLIKGANPSLSLTSARRLGENALLSEDSGNEKQAFYGYQGVVQILSTILQQNEFKSNQQTLLPQFEEVFAWMKLNVLPRSAKLEERLKESEAKQLEADRAKGNEANGSGMTPLPSVADRIKSLQEKGLQLQTGGLMSAATNAVKSRRPNAPSKSTRPTAFPTSSTPTPLSTTSLIGFSSPTSPHQAFPTIHEPISPQPTASHALFPSSPSSTHASSTSQPQFVSLSSLGPPSPTSSAPPSPISNTPDLPQFNKILKAIGATSPDFERAFPSLEEWEETLQHGAGHSINGLGISGHERSPAQWDTQLPPSSFQRSPTSPQQPRPSPHPSLSRRFSLLSIERPASTPPRPLPIPDSPTNENAGLSEYATPLTPRDIFSLQQKRKQILFLDLRSRERFESERVKGDVICVEPTFSSTHDLTAERITSSLELSPKQERILFENRRSFSMVVVYEEDEPTEMSKSVARALWDMEFRKEVKLKRAPVLMSGGFKRWKEEVGDGGVARTSVTPSATGSHKLGTRESSVSLKSSVSGSGSGSVNGYDEAGSAVGGVVSKQLTGPKLSPTSTANGWAIPLQPKTSGSVSPSGSGSIPTAPVVNGSPTPPVLQPVRKPSPPRDLQPSSSRSSLPPPLYPSSTYLESSDSTHRLDGTSSSRPLTVPQVPQSPSTGSFGITRDQFWVPPASSREQEDALRRKAGLTRPPSSTLSNLDHHYSVPTAPRHISTPTPITYPSQPARSLPPIQMPTPQSHTSLNGVVSPPPQASIRPSPISRRRSDYLDQPSQAPPPSFSPVGSRRSIDYPSYSTQSTIRPPPPVAADRHQHQRLPNGSASYNTPPPVPSSTRPNGVPSAFKTSSTMPNGTILPSDYPVMYWSDYQVSTSGLKNLGNTCYMNSTIQCLSSVYPFAIYFSDGRFKTAINRTNALGSKGEVALAFASLLHQMRQGDMLYLTPTGFRKSICLYAPQFSGSDQHDTEEFLNFLLDGLHEDLNRVTTKTPYRPSPEREAELEVLPQQLASEQEWRIYRMSNNSIVVDYFQGQFRNRLQCLTCKKTSTTYNPFSDLSLPIPAGRGISKVTLEQCLNAFVKEEIMEKGDAWHCPNCKVLRRASKNLSLSRLPAVLIIVLKRFSFKGPFTDKLETLVEFPIKDLDLTNYMPPPLPGQNQSYVKSMSALREDPSTQVPPYKYDLFAVTNHYGSLSSGHYTAFINARGGWQYCDDSRVTPADNREIVSKAAYVLYYKRQRP